MSDPETITKPAMSQSLQPKETAQEKKLLILLELKVLAERIKDWIVDMDKLQVQVQVQGDLDRNLRDVQQTQERIDKHALVLKSLENKYKRLVEEKEEEKRREEQAKTEAAPREKKSKKKTKKGKKRV